jgi:hypothetical protein
LGIEMHPQDAGRNAAAFSLVAASFKNAGGNYYDLRDDVRVLADLLRGPSLSLNVQGLEPQQVQAFVQAMATRGVVFRSVMSGAPHGGASSPGTVMLLPAKDGVPLSFQALTKNEKIRMLLLLPAVQPAQARR